MCASVWYVHLSTGAFDSQRPWIPLAGVTGGFESHDMGSRSRTRVL